VEQVRTWALGFEKEAFVDGTQDGGLSLHMSRTERP